MKKFIALVIVLLLAAAPAMADFMVVHMTSVCYDPNHVGTKWQAQYSVGGNQIFDGDIVEFFPGQYEFYTVIGEYDTTPDIGETVSTFNVTANRLTKGFTVEQVVTVTENHGVYKDYWTEWYVTYQFIPVPGAVYVLN